MILIALGANAAGNWGDPAAAIARTPEVLEQSFVAVKAFSPLYLTEPLGPSRTAFFNAATLVETAMPALSLLAKLHFIEAKAGRTPNSRKCGKRWGDRALDLDLLSYHNIVINWECHNGGAIPRRGARLILPHPELHKRPFVLVPLMKIAPAWRHPVFKLTPRQMLNRIKHGRDGRILDQLGGDVNISNRQSEDYLHFRSNV